MQAVYKRLTDFEARFARYEPTQALTLAYAREALLRANEALAAAGLPVPPDPGPITITGTPPTTGTVGQQYSFTPSTANGSGAKVFSLASGTLLAGLALNASTGAITGPPTAAGTMTALSIRVTDDTGSAATTPTTVTIAAATTPGAVTVDPLVTRSGQQYTFTARRSGDVSQAVSRTMQVAASTDYPPGSPASDWPNGAYATATANFAAGSPTASFTITAPVAAQPE